PPPSHDAGDAPLDHRIAQSTIHIAPSGLLPSARWRSGAGEGGPLDGPPACVRECPFCWSNNYIWGWSFNLAPRDWACYTEPVRAPQTAAALLRGPFRAFATRLQGP